MATALEHRDHIPFLMPYADYFFYAALIGCRLANSDGDEMEAQVEHIDACIEQMSVWAREACPENFEHRLALMRAERARVAGRPCTDLYQAAITLARRDGYLQNEALASELAARYHLDSQRPAAATGYLMDAVALYERWGALPKAAQLRREFRVLLQPAEPREARHSSVTTTSKSISPQALDLVSMLKACQTISSEIVLERLLERLLELVLENAGARRGALLVADEDGLRVRATAQLAPGDDGERMQAQLRLDTPLADAADLPLRIVRYTWHTGKTLLLDDAINDAAFADDGYVRRVGVRSVVCLPLYAHAEPFGVLYLENAGVAGAFTRDRLEVLTVLSAQFSISYQNARLYNSMEREVARQTVQLRSQNDALEQTLRDLRTTQDRLVHAEKMASLGAFTAGIAHELNNPLNFVTNFAAGGADLVDEIAEVTSEEERQELLDELRGNFAAIGRNGARASSIVSGMVRHAGGTGGAREPTDFNAIVTQHARARVGVELRLQLGADVGAVSVVPQEIATLVKNLVENAMDAVGARPDSGLITVSTTRQAECVAFCVEDNGPGVAPALATRIFEPFFTTKAGTQGTGLGLSLCYDIVVHGHGGTIEIEDADPGARFIVRIPLEKTPAAG